MPAAPSLPDFIEPMLCQSGEAFDSDRHLFEIKWDGTRGLAFIETGGRVRFLNRRRFDLTERYPEVTEPLSRLPPGTVLDGEVVVLKAGKPDFASLESRDQARGAFKIRQLARAMPATYIVFDQLYRDYTSIMDQFLQPRRQVLQQTIEQAASGRIVLSQGIVGGGKAYFDEAVRQGLEGIVAKRLDSRYLAGKRTDCWIKIKRQESMVAAIIGYVPEGKDTLAALILAGEIDGRLQYVGKVGTGFDARTRRELTALLAPHRRDTPMVPAKVKDKIVVWIEPSVYCRVRYMERTADGRLRAPVFEGLYGH